MSSLSSSTSPLPPGWATGFDPNEGRVYYFHQETGETTWTWPAPPQPPLGLVPQAQSLVQQLDHNIVADNDEKIRLELDTLTAGQIADLCHLHQQKQNEQHAATSSTTAHCYYQPIQPGKLVMLDRALAEPARMESRLHALYKELDQLKSQQQ